MFPSRLLDRGTERALLRTPDLPRTPGDAMVTVHPAVAKGPTAS